jgi:hypothetical protein
MSKVCGSEFGEAVAPDTPCNICGFPVREHGPPTVALSSKPLVQRLREEYARTGAYAPEATCRHGIHPYDCRQGCAPPGFEAADEIESYRAAIKVAYQALLEFSHAQESGPGWYTRGQNGMYAQVRMWLDRGLEAVRGALGPYDERGQYLKERTTHETPDAHLSSEPLACPFCGEAADLEEVDEHSSVEPSAVRFSVGCATEDCFGSQSMVSFPRRIDAITAWNRRV